jgi:hypothetical protein
MLLNYFILREVPSLYYQFKFIHHYYQNIGDDYIIKEIAKLYFACVAGITSQALYLYGVVIADELINQEIDNPLLSKNKFEFLKQHIGIIDDLELLNQIGIDRETLVSGNTLKKNFDKLARKI